MWIYVWDTEIKWIYLWDTPVKEVYVWTTKVRPSATPITTPWIYHNSDLWLISLSSDGSTRHTIADKNLWATSTSIGTTDNYWHYYQWWNNYAFPTTWGVSTSSTAVDAKAYWPNKYYYSTSFITAQPWDSSGNANLWWWTTDTNDARKWPCPYWWHIPSNTECQSLIDALNTIVWWKKQAQFEQYLFMTNPKIRQASSGNVITSTYAYIQASTQQSSSNRYAIRFNASTNATVTTSNKSQWNVIRPFKNEPIQPREWDEWTSLYNLKSLSELAAMTTVNAEAELNTHPSDYYNKFNSEWKLVYIWWYDYLTNDWTQSWLVEWDNWYTIIWYESDQNMWSAMPA